MQTAYLLPLTVGSLVVAVGALGFRASVRHGFAPLMVGVGAGVALIVGRFILEMDWISYTAVAALIGASVWNAWPIKRATSASDVPAEVLLQIGIISKGDSNMAAKRKVEVFSAGCPACQDAIALVNSVACPSCEVTVLDMNDAKVASRAKALGVRSVPAVVIDGKLAGCCSGSGPDEATLRAAGLGQSIA